MIARMNRTDSVRTWNESGGEGVNRRRRRAGERRAILTSYKSRNYLFPSVKFGDGPGSDSMPVRAESWSDFNAG